MNKTEFRKLCVKSITGNIDETEMQLLNNYLSGSKEHNDEFEKIKSIWERSDINENPELPDIDFEWESLNEKIRTSNKIENERDSIFNKILVFTKSLFTPIWKPAFVGLFLAALSVIIFSVLQKEEIQKYSKITTANKEHKTILLPDGSSVYLNSGSAIEYLNDFNRDTRKVILEGEAFFSVTKNEKPFVITTENASIKVLGTRFDVWTRNEQTRVIVREGKVNLKPKVLKKKGVILTKNELSTVINNSNPTPPENVDTDYLLGWMNNKLVFNRTSLKEITGELERFYNVKINLEDDKLNNLTLTGSFDNPNVDSVLNMICLALNLKFNKTDNKKDHEQEGYLIEAKNKF